MCSQIMSGIVDGTQVLGADFLISRMRNRARNGPRNLLNIKNLWIIWSIFSILWPSHQPSRRDFMGDLQLPAINRRAIINCSYGTTRGEMSVKRGESEFLDQKNQPSALGVANLPTNGELQKGERIFQIKLFLDAR